MVKTHSPGARQFRIVILLAAAVAFAVLGVESIRHYLDYMHAVNNRGGQDPNPVSLASPHPAVLSTASVTMRTIAAPPSTRERSLTPS
jgi:hypothetical protein